ncbi:Ribulose-phosphate 3-epimerase [Buchnera aphidicola (Neophyllaphis podocarpi)]|uniref:ribulose-phosphate 3-epimerase n=1 Tax=Buchnera aphidicola TaxID=9 RepID=UPI0031B81BB2
MRKFLIAPSILSANFAKLGDEILKVISAGGDLIHFDVMDNHYVPSITLGPMVLKSLRDNNINVPIDVHLMTKPVDNLIPMFAKAGANFITFHPESTDHIDKTLNLIKRYGCKSGLVFNPSTSLNYLDYILDKLDLVLIMSVNPGLSNQDFILKMLDKIKQVKNILNINKKNIILAVDGGIKLNNIYDIAFSGADMFIIGSAIFSCDNYKNIIQKFRLKLNKLNSKSFH